MNPPFASGNPPFLMCWPKAKLLQRTSHSAQLIQMRAGYRCRMSAMISCASTTNQQGACVLTVSAGKCLRHLFTCLGLPYSKVPAFLNVVDIAGLVKGAHSGQGLGNAFLSHINACDGIFHMTRKPWLLLFADVVKVLCYFNHITDAFLTDSAVFLQVRLMTRTSFMLRVTLTLCVTSRSFTRSCG